MSDLPFLQLAFFTSELGRYLFVPWAITLVICHMQYVHSPVDISRRFTTLELVADIIGLTWMRNLIAADFPDLAGLHLFLFVHFVVHVLSLVWSLVAWPSLDKHMMDFRRRTLPAPFVWSEWLYEQSDTALYAVLAVRTLSTLSPEQVMPIVMGLSMLAGSRRFKAWFSNQSSAA